MRPALTLPRCPRSEDPAASALQARAFAWYLGVVLVGLTVLWAVVPRMAPGLGVVADALLPTILVFDALSLVALWRLPRLLRVLHVAQYASFFPILLGYLALTIALAPDAAARHAAIAAFGIWIPVVVTVTFQVFGSRDGLLGALAFVAATAVVVAGSVARGGALEGPGLAYVTMLVVASLAFAVIVYGAARLSERTNDARIAAAVAAELALRDPLTGAHTRFALDQRFEQELARARRGGPPLAVYFLDLDGFKDVNDTLGHATGDALLRAFAERILGTVRASDTVARYGGDEFVVLANVADEAEAHALATRLVAATAEPVVADGARLELGVCIGLALHPVDGVDRPSLIHAADAAMYAAKAAGRRRWMGAPRRAAAGPRPSEPRLDAICASCG